MANTHTTLTGLFEDIADAIRAKTGSSDTIIADNFPSAIASIPSSSTGTVSSAVITVVYPAGASCSITNNNVTYNAPNTSGAATFIVTPGTWSATAVKDGLSKTKTVTISEGQALVIELSLWDGELYNQGDENSEITGGWQNLTSRANIVTKKETSIQINGSANYSVAGVGTTNKIDLAGYTTLHINVVSFNNSQYKAILGVIDALTFEEIVGDNGYGGEAIHNQVAFVDTNKAGEYTVDISELANPSTSDTSEYYIVYYIMGTSGVTKTAVFNKIWLT